MILEPKPLILVSNDDGVEARGILLLREALASLAEIVTVAPLHEHSAKSHAITLDRPLRCHERKPGVYAVDGTPVDCVYVALHHERLLPRRPDVVVSGINHGPNLGRDIYYSGTVAAAREGALRGVPSIAISLMPGGDLDAAARVATRVVARFLETSQPAGESVLLNVNVPVGEPRGFRATRLGHRHYVDGISVRSDPRGRDYFWIGGPGDVRHEPLEGSDTDAIDQGFVSITPLLLHATNPDHFGVAAYVAGPSEEEP